MEVLTIVPSVWIGTTASVQALGFAQLGFDVTGFDVTGLDETFGRDVWARYLGVKHVVCKQLAVGKRHHQLA